MPTAAIAGITVGTVRGFQREIEAGLFNCQTNLINIIVRANLELRHPVRRRFEQFGQSRYRAIMQIRRSRPNIM